MIANKSPMRTASIEHRMTERRSIAIVNVHKAYMKMGNWRFEKRFGKETLFDVCVRSSEVLASQIADHVHRLRSSKLCENRNFEFRALCSRLANRGASADDLDSLRSASTPVFVQTYLSVCCNHCHSFIANVSVALKAPLSSRTSGTFREEGENSGCSNFKHSNNENRPLKRFLQLLAWISHWLTDHHCCPLRLLLSQLLLMSILSTSTFEDLLARPIRSSCLRCVWVVFSNRTNFVSACGSASESNDLLTLLGGGSNGIEKLPKKLYMRFIAIHRLHWSLEDVSLKAVRKPIPHNFTRCIFQAVQRDVAALDVVTIDAFRSLCRLLNGMRFYYDSSLLQKAENHRTPHCFLEDFQPIAIAAFLR